MTLNIYVQITIEFCAIVITLAALVYLFRKGNKKLKSTRVLKGLLAACVIYYVVLSLGLYYDGAPDGEIYILKAAILLNYILPFVLIFIGAYLMRIVTDKGGGTRGTGIQKAIYVVCGIGFLMALVASATGLYYVFDENNHYSRTDHLWIHTAILLLALLLMLIRAILNRKVYLRREYQAILCFVLFPVAAALMQAFIYGVPFDCIAILLSSIIIFSIYRAENSGLTSIHEDLPLTRSNIDMISDEIEVFMSKLGVETVSIIRTRLKIEESLLRMHDKLGEDAVIDFSAMKPFGRAVIRMEVEGEPFNPLSRIEEDEANDWSYGLLRTTGFTPRYSYSNGRNIVKLTFSRMRMNPMIKMLLAILAGILLGYVALHALSLEDQQYFNEQFLIPVYELFVNILYCAASPIIFFMIITSILNSGTISDQGGRNGNVLVRYFSFSILLGIIAVFLTVIPFGFNIVIDDDKVVGTGNMLRAIFSVVPENIITPFEEVNSPQLILMAIVLGCIMAALGARGKGIIDLTRQANLICMKLAELIGRLIPYFTVLMIALIMLRGLTNNLIDIIMVLLVSVIITLVAIVGTAGYVAISKGVKYTALLRKCWPAFKSALRKGSVDSAFGESEKCCVEKLGIQKFYASDCLPIGTVMYMPANVIGAIVFTIYSGMTNGNDMTLVWCSAAVLLSTIMIVATPPIPGANFLAYTVILAQLGINQQFIIIAIIFDLIYGSFSLAANQMLLQLETILQADKLGLLNRDALIREEDRRTPDME